MSKARSTGNLNNSILISDTGAITFVSGSTTLAALSTTGQLSGSAPALSASYAATASYATNFNVSGTITATTLVVQTVTSSVSLITGSTQFGSLSSNTHVFTGSIDVTGSIRAGSHFISAASTSVDGLGPYEYVYLGSFPNAAPRGTAVRLGDVAGANYVISTGGYNLAFYKHVSGSSSGYSNVFSIMGTNATNAVPAVFISGSLGIGTNIPGALLHISGGATDFEIQMQNTSGSAFLQLRNGATGFRPANNIGIVNTITSGSVALQAAAGGDIRFGISTTEYMRVTSAGYVGVGTTSPNVHFMVEGSRNGYYIARFNNTNASGYGIKIINGNDSNDALRISNAADTADNVLLYGNGNATFKGQVQIGNSSTAQRSLVVQAGSNSMAIMLKNPSNGDGTIYATGGATSLNYRFDTYSTSYALYISDNGAITTQNYLNLTDVVSQVDNASTWPIISFSGANGVAGINKSAGTYDWGIIKAPTSYGYYGRVVGGFHGASTIDQGFITSGWTMQFIINGSNGNAFLRGTLTQGSDARIKANVTNLNYGLAEVMQLRPISYNKKIFNKDTDGNIVSESIDTENKYIGFIAQEVKPIIPEVVNGDENSENPERGLSIEYQNMTALLVKAIQELKVENDTLKEILQRNNIQ